jgi:hypothetical protein
MISTDQYAWVIPTLMIFIARICDVSMETIQYYLHIQGDQVPLTCYRIF